MAEWVNATESPPPSCLDVLLHVALYREDSGYFWTDCIRSGFWADDTFTEEPGYYVNKDLEDHRRLDTTYEKVIAWTLKPSKSLIKIPRKTEHGD